MSCTACAANSPWTQGYKVYTEYKSRKATHKKGKDGRLREKTVLEELESTEESSEEEEPEREPVPLPGTTDNPVTEANAGVRLGFWRPP